MASSQRSPYRGDAAGAPEQPARSQWMPSARLGAAAMLGSLWFLLAAAWYPLVWFGVLWWAALAAAVAADWRALRAARRVSAHRSVEPVLSLGAPNRVELRLRSRAPYAFRCLLRDEPPLDFETSQPRLSCDLPPAGECAAAYTVTPGGRGDFSFEALNVRLWAGFGLLVRQMRFDLGQAVKVYPSIAGIQAYQLALRKQHLYESGVHPSRLLSTGLEFEALRAYVEGDELRRIDWKATARHDRPITREYNVERSQHIIICLDLGRTMLSRLGTLTKADHAVNAAALLAHAAVRLDDWVGLYAFSSAPVAYVPPRKRQFPLILDSLYGLQPERAESDYHRCFLDAANRIRKRALVVLFTDLPDPDSSARLLHYVTLLTRRHLVLCAALSDYELYELSARPPRRPGELYERTVATELLADRQRALRALRERGAVALDATPANLSAAVLNRYLEIKAKARL